MKKSVAIIGSGPAGLILATFLDHQKYNVTIYEKNKAAGRKFLVAGKGGFNLTHSESIDSFIGRYHPIHFLEEALQSFNNQDLRNWLLSIGIPTYEGSSGRIFPQKGIKPIEVLQAIMRVLQKKNVSINYNRLWTGWDKAGNVLFNNDISVSSDIIVFALGGSSWKVTGSDGKWLKVFQDQGIDTFPFQPVNCAFEVNWPYPFIQKYEGKPLKNIIVSCNDVHSTGELVITAFGLEGNAIYPLSLPILNQLEEKGEAIISLDLKPPFNADQIKMKMEQSKSTNITTFLEQKLNLSKSKIQLLKAFTTKEEFLQLPLLIKKIKALPIPLISPAPIDEAISTIGGIPTFEINSKFELQKMPGTFCIGEMVDWFAPTGGYLLQGCFSMGVFLARFLNTTHQ